MLALFTTKIFAALGYMLVQILMKGLTLKSGSVGRLRLNLLKVIQVPPLVLMIIFGCLARKYVNDSYMSYYPEVLAEKFRWICLALILMHDAMELNFKG